jgi:hypothetical protein
LDPTAYDEAMEISHALLADYADVVNGKLYLMGGGWDRFFAPNVPVQMRVAIAVGVRIGWEETNKPVPVRIALEDDDGAELMHIDGQVNVGRPPNLPPGSDQLAQMCANVAINVPRHGGYRVRITAGEGELAVERRLTFRVEEKRP